MKVYLKKVIKSKIDQGTLSVLKKTVSVGTQNDCSGQTEEEYLLFIFHRRQWCKET